MKRVLVICTGNSCRSQMAEGFLRFFAKDGAEIYSAGIESHGLDPIAVMVMKEDGIDISHHTSNQIDAYADKDFDYIITVCDNAHERCPYFPSTAKKIHQNFPDPSKMHGTEEDVANEYRRVRQLIKIFCHDFAKTYLS